jgi:tetratricopeptide (TPR) repeat protein/ADP-heptose:LPS heptosyltransferase
MDSTLRPTDIGLVLRCEGLGDCLFAVPVIKKLRSVTDPDQRFVLFTYHKELFAKCPYVYQAYDLTEQGLELVTFRLGKLVTLFDISKLSHWTIDTFDFISIPLGIGQLSFREKQLEYFPVEEDVSQQYDVVLNTSVTWPSRSWPIEQWQALANHIRALGYSVAVVGKDTVSKHDNMVKKSVGLDGCADLTNKLSLDQTFYTIQRASLFVTCQNGLSVLSGATNTEIVVLDMSIEWSKRAIYRREDPHYRCTYVKGACSIYCCESFKCSRYGEFRCIPSVDQVVSAVEEKLRRLPRSRSAGGVGQPSNDHHARSPHAVEAEEHCRRGRLLLGSGRAQEALDSFTWVLTHHGETASALAGQARALLGLGRVAEAETCVDRALQLAPECADAHFAKGNLALGRGRADEAVASYDKALACEPDLAMALTNRGVALMRLDRRQEALDSYDKAVAIQPDCVAAHANRAEVLVGMGRPAEALGSSDKALALEPDHLHALGHRCAALILLRRYDEALTSLDRALALAPRLVHLLVWRGVVLRYLRRLDDAEESFCKAISIAPDDVEANFHKGLLRLLLGDYPGGWDGYERRWQRQGREAVLSRGFREPLWLGQGSLAGKTILLHAEQGLGDTIQFCRYAPLVREAGAHVLLEVQPPLKRLLEGLSAVDRLVARGEPLPAFDLHCPLGSLPLAFATTLGTIPAHVPYLATRSALTASWSERLGRKKGPRVGLVWAGNAGYGNDGNRSMPATELDALLGKGFELVSLQKRVRDRDLQWLRGHPEVRHFGSDLQDAADTAALVALMDVVISVDTFVAHLAGAMGKPLWILLPFVPDWRWMLDRDDSPWYPTARLIRQPARDDWKTVMARAIAALRAAGAVVPVEGGAPLPFVD